VYTGNNLAGPTVFAIIYSSVTIWAALFSRMLLSRSLVKLQWFGVCLVVLGLALAAMDSKTVGKNVFAGACLILVGSSFHGLTYVMSEKIMTPSPITTNSSGANHAAKEPEHLSIRANCAVQGIVATLAVLLWQIFYTLPRLEPLVLAPMRESGTTALHALFILVTITMANLVHSLTFFVTLRHFPGGATSAGVLKGLQAVLVFAASAYLLCEKWGGRETCWSNSKFVSLVIVVSGIMMYGAFTEKKGKIRQSSFCDENVDIL
jgi:drug/metabolite transporter (DMT)-like permease